MKEFNVYCRNEKTERFLMRTAILQCCKSARFSREHVEIDDKNLTDLVVLESRS